MLLPKNVHFRTCLPGSCSRKSENMVMTDPLCIRGGNNSLVKYDTEVEYEQANSEGRSRIRNPPSDAKRSYQERQNFSTNIMPKPSTDMHTVKGEQDTSSPAIGNP